MYRTTKESADGVCADGIVAFLHQHQLEIICTWLGTEAINFKCPLLVTELSAVNFINEAC
ncbi:MAG: hypothetical protein ABIO76_03425 [Ginsengibacter sp.]